ncbi:TniB family NTP-binding protein [Leptolyngbya sp. PL-A3]|uniref:TniB family NTP-binding protein n=1 Tax=Leptolyngbya sp. PL-A3 TaxID=2933911 RepID=UPI003296C70C
MQNFFSWLDRCIDLKSSGCVVKTSSQRSHIVYQYCVGKNQVDDQGRLNICPVSYVLLPAKCTQRHLLSLMSDPFRIPSAKESLSQIKMRLAEKLNVSGIRMLMVENAELQDIDVLKTLFDLARLLNVPCILVGDKGLVKMLSADEQLRRRFSEVFSL